MHLAKENEFTERFWGRIPLQSGAALYFFQRRSPLQRALHQLKYHRQAHLGIQLGRLLGGQLRQSPLFQAVEAIIPVPLHPDKEKMRGYNQSAMIARGVSEAMNVPVLEGVLVRRRHTESQTRKRRLERFKNVAESFVLAKPQAITGKHILLVDDVLTTGATLEACGRALFAAPIARLSMATVAIAMSKIH
ncbi:MAG: ComF family protein [Saprospiraceae bacterium]|nr:ComF family protein [Saprospiraceae bacterium]MDW8483740.1 ComF family protein [Saprospiraceae bacterium]